MPMDPVESNHMMPRSSRSYMNSSAGVLIEKIIVMEVVYFYYLLQDHTVSWKISRGFHKLLLHLKTFDMAFIFPMGSHMA